MNGLFDLVKPTVNRGNYGIRFTDFGKPDRNDNVQLRVILTPSGDWSVQFIEANHVTGVFDIRDSDSLTGVGDYQQILLTLTRGDTSNNLVAAALELIDTDGSLSPIAYDFNQTTASIFDGENWTRASLFAFAPRGVPIPATLLLISAGLLGMAGRFRKLKSET